jgi:hypothetical protein
MSLATEHRVTRKSGRSTSSGSVARPEVMIDRDRQHNIAVRAYYLAERRGFVPGYELDDWLDAERLEKEGFLS